MNDRRTLGLGMEGAANSPLATIKPYIGKVWLDNFVAVRRLTLYQDEYLLERQTIAGIMSGYLAEPHRRCCGPLLVPACEPFQG